jgi:hypothetical protein
MTGEELDLSALRISTWQDHFAIVVIFGVRS